MQLSAPYRPAIVSGWRRLRSTTLRTCSDSPSNADPIRATTYCRSWWQLRTAEKSARTTCWRWCSDALVGSTDTNTVQTRCSLEAFAENPDDWQVLRDQAGRTRNSANGFSRDEVAGERSHCLGADPGAVLNRLRGRMAQRRMMGRIRRLG